MPRITRTLLLWTLILTACAPIFPTTEAAPQSAPPAAETPTVSVVTVTPASSDAPILPNPKIIPTFQTPHIDQPPNPDALTTVAPSNPQECAYQWAYQDLPQLSGDFLAAVQALHPRAQATAFVFGENCVHADGSTTFIPMETDFNITLQVSDVANESDLGDWIVKVMQVIEQIPADQIVGPRPGRVSIMFQGSGEQKGVSFYLDEYRALPPGLSSAEIYAALQTQ
jgi:hypothetical protein